MSTPAPARGMAFLATLLISMAATAGGAAQVTMEFPRFDRELLLETTSETSANVSFGDLNGDGTLDIVLAKGRHWPLVSRVLLGDGKGGIVEAYDLGDIADRTYSGQLADLDGDGDLDVVISNDRPDAKLVYLNDGAGRFAAGSSYGDPEWPTRNASVADVDGDSFPDIIVANRGRDLANYVCLNDGAGGFGAGCIAFAREPATTITPADFDGDGRIDLAVPHRNGGQSVVYLAGIDASLSDMRRIPFGPPDAAFRVAAAADLDGDGSLDIVASDERRGVFAYFGQGGESFSPGLTISDGTIVPYALTVADLDGDSSIDIVVGNAEAPSAIHFNDGSGRGFTVRRFGDVQGVVYGFAIGDLDGDGYQDIGMARSDAPNIVYFGDPALPGATPSGANHR